MAGIVEKIKALPERIGTPIAGFAKRHPKGVGWGVVGVGASLGALAIYKALRNAKRRLPPEKDWKGRIARQEAILKAKGVPSSREVAEEEARKRLADIGGKAYQAGYALRSVTPKPGLDELLREMEPLGASRDIMIDMPSMKGAEWVEDSMWSKEAGPLSVVTDPMRYMAQDVKANIARAIDKHIQEGRRVTTDPKTLVGYYPSVAATVPLAFSKGYQAADKEKMDKLHAAMDARVDAAKQEFEAALQEEFEQGKTAAAALGGEDNSKLEVDPEELKMGIEIEKEHTPNPKLAEQIARDHLKEIPDYYSRLKRMEAKAKKRDEATPGGAVKESAVFLDALAEVHVKAAAGGLNQLLGVYLAAAGLLGTGGYVVGGKFVEKHDPRFQKMKIMLEAARQRLRSKPIPVLVSTGEKEKGTTAREELAEARRPAVVTKPEESELSEGEAPVGEEPPKVS